MPLLLILTHIAPRSPLPSAPLGPGVAFVVLEAEQTPTQPGLVQCSALASRVISHLSVKGVPRCTTRVLPSGRHGMAWHGIARNVFGQLPRFCHNDNDNTKHVMLLC